VIGRKIIYYDVLTSTNDVLKTAALRGEDEGTVVIANEQTRGRGRRGRSWHSPRGLGLYLSFLLKPDLGARQLGLVSLCSAIAVAGAIRKTTGRTAFLKWPNDIFLADRKVGGILAEAGVISGLGTYVVVGVGVNVLHRIEDFPPELQKASSSILSCTGKTICKHDLSQAIIVELNSFFRSSSQNGWPERIIQKWMSLCGHIGDEVGISRENDTLKGIFVRIDEYGNAVIATENGEQMVVPVGDVSLRKEGVCS
jgi:BirA family biotin operon repressor/biotin-[acetyl-CoA-carboxylase] ligase